MVIIVNFKKNLRDELDYQDMTVKELSAKTGIAKGTLDSYLGRRASVPPADVAVRIARALGVSVEYLVTGAEQKSEKRFRLGSQNARSIIDMVTGFTENENEILLGVAKVLKKQAEK